MWWKQSQIAVPWGHQAVRVGLNDLSTIIKDYAPFICDPKQVFPKSVDGIVHYFLPGIEIDMRGAGSASKRPGDWRSGRWKTVRSGNYARCRVKRGFTSPARPVESESVVGIHLIIMGMPTHTQETWPGYRQAPSQKLSTAKRELKIDIKSYNLWIW
jgi:hypothetical protein